MPLRAGTGLPTVAFQLDGTFRVGAQKQHVLRLPHDHVGRWQSVVGAGHLIRPSAPKGGWGGHACSSSSGTTSREAGESTDFSWSYEPPAILYRQRVRMVSRRKNWVAAHRVTAHSSASPARPVKTRTGLSTSTPTSWANMMPVIGSTTVPATC